MPGETDLNKLLKTLDPELNQGEYVFCSVAGTHEINPVDILGSFRENEGLTVIIKKSTADLLGIPYTFIASWITLNVHSSLDAIGLAAIFSTAIANAGIACNVISAYYHDHLFVSKSDAEKAMEILRQLTQ